MEYGYILILAIMAGAGAYKYVKTKQIKEIKIAKIVPQQRDMDVDFKYMKFLIKEECDNVEKLVLDTKHRNKGEFSLIEDNIHKEAVILASKSVLNKLSEEQRKIIAFYCGVESLEKFICDIIIRDLRERVNKFNNKTLNRYNMSDVYNNNEK